VADLWRRAEEQLARGERAGRIVTVEPDEVGVPSRRELDRDERLYVYKRADRPCHRCGSLITSRPLGDRRVWWCPTCQPR
jgi:formamidopyrimidine-DNA glycosylase